MVESSAEDSGAARCERGVCVAAVGEGEFFGDEEGVGIVVVFEGGGEEMILGSAGGVFRGVLASATEEEKNG